MRASPTGVSSDDVLELDSALGLCVLVGVLAATTQVGTDSVIAVDAINLITLSGVDLSSLQGEGFPYV